MYEISAPLNSPFSLTNYYPIIFLRIQVGLKRMMFVNNSSSKEFQLNTKKLSIENFVNSSKCQTLCKFTFVEYQVMNSARNLMLQLGIDEKLVKPLSLRVYKGGFYSPHTKAAPSNPYLACNKMKHFDSNKSFFVSITWNL